MKQVLYMLLLSMAFFNSGCGGGGDDDVIEQRCTSNSEVRKKNVNGFDFRQASPYYNQVVANFKFTQTSTTYTGGNDCKPMECVTTLSIQNVTTKKITFDYNITFTLNFVSWNYQDVATIEPSATLDIGQINNNCASLALGQVFIQSANISYQ